MQLALFSEEQIFYAETLSEEELAEFEKILDDEKEFNPHSFRHSALENFSTGDHYVAKKLEKKFTIQELKLLAHHEDLSTTDSYLKNKDEEMLLEAFGI